MARTKGPDPDAAERRLPAPRVNVEPPDAIKRDVKPTEFDADGMRRRAAMRLKQQRPFNIPGRHVTRRARFHRATPKLRTLRFGLPRSPRFAVIHGNAAALAYVNAGNHAPMIRAPARARKPAPPPPHYGGAGLTRRHR